MPAITNNSPTRPGPSVPSLAMVVTLAAACADDSGSVADPFSHTLWTAAGPELRIGTVEGDPDYVFGPVFALEPGPDGMLYSLHFQEATVRRWTPEGLPAGSVGRAGEGPGEFERPVDMGFFGDSLWVWDMGAYRASYFDLGGEFVGSVSPPVAFGSLEESPPRPARPFRDGTFLGRQPAWSHLVATGELTETSVVRMDADGGNHTLLWNEPHEPRDGLALMDDNGVTGSFGSQPFGDHVRHTVFEAGLVVVERRAWTGEGEPVVTLTRIDLAGDTVFRRAIPYTPEPLPAERLDSAIRATTDAWHRDESGVTKDALEARIREATYKPAYLPAVGGARVTGDGNIWLERYSPVRSGTGEWLKEWWILDIDGEPMARAHLPADLRVMHLGEEAIWGTERDELDVEYIVRYRLVKED